MRVEIIEMIAMFHFRFCFIHDHCFGKIIIPSKGMTKQSKQTRK